MLDPSCRVVGALGILVLVVGFEFAPANIVAVPCRLATLTVGTGFSEGVMLEDLPHSASAVALTPSRVWQIPREVPDEVRVAKP